VAYPTPKKSADWRWSIFTNTESQKVSLQDVHLEVITEFLMWIIHTVVFWGMILCNDVAGYQCFRGPCCFHLQNQKTSTHIFIAMKILSLAWIVQHHCTTSKCFCKYWTKLCDKFFYHTVIV